METISVLGPSGHVEIKWDAENEAEREEARRAVADLKRQGYSFFLVDGTPADEVTAGGGHLVVRRLEAAEVVEAATDEAAEKEGEVTTPKRGRKPGGKVVAIPAMRGG